MPFHSSVPEIRIELDQSHDAADNANVNGNGVQQRRQQQQTMVRGRVHIRVAKTVPVHRVCIDFVGDESVNLRAWAPLSSKTVSREVLCRRLTVHRGGMLNGGHHIYPFTVRVPPWVPSTLTRDMCRIRYVVRVAIERASLVSLLPSLGSSSSGGGGSGASDTKAVGSAWVREEEVECRRIRTSQRLARRKRVDQSVGCPDGSCHVRIWGSISRDVVKPGAHIRLDLSARTSDPRYGLRLLAASFAECVSCHVQVKGEERMVRKISNLVTCRLDALPDPSTTRPNTASIVAAGESAGVAESPQETNADADDRQRSSMRSDPGQQRRRPHRNQGHRYRASDTQRTDFANTALSPEDLRSSSSGSGNDSGSDDDGDGENAGLNVEAHGFHHISRGIRKTRSRLAVLLRNNNSNNGGSTTSLQRQHGGSDKAPGTSGSDGIANYHAAAQQEPPPPPLPPPPPPPVPFLPSTHGGLAAGGGSPASPARVQALQALHASQYADSGAARNSRSRSSSDCGDPLSVVRQIQASQLIQVPLGLSQFSSEYVSREYRLIVVAEVARLEDPEADKNSVHTNDATRPSVYLPLSAGADGATNYTQSVQNLGLSPVLSAGRRSAGQGPAGKGGSNSLDAVRRKTSLSSRSSPAGSISSAGSLASASVSADRPQGAWRVARGSDQQTRAGRRRQSDSGIEQQARMQQQQQQQNRWTVSEQSSAIAEWTVDVVDCFDVQFDELVSPEYLEKGGLRSVESAEEAEIHAGKYTFEPQLSPTPSPRGSPGMGKGRAGSVVGGQTPSDTGSASPLPSADSDETARRQQTGHHRRSSSGLVGFLMRGFRAGAPSSPPPPPPPPPPLPQSSQPPPQRQPVLIRKEASAPAAARGGARHMRSVSGGGMWREASAPRWVRHGSQEGGTQVPTAPARPATQQERRRQQQQQQALQQGSRGSHGGDSSGNDQDLVMYPLQPAQQQDRRQQDKRW